MIKVEIILIVICNTFYLEVTGHSSSYGNKLVIRIKQIKLKCSNMACTKVKPEQMLAS